MKVILNHVYKSFGEKKVLTDVNYNLEGPGLTRIEGPSGYGKTTIFRIISGLLEPDEGEVIVEGRLVYMFQEHRLFPMSTLLSNVTFGRRRDREAGVKYLSAVGLGGELNTRADKASGGMKQRTAFARALLSAENAEIVLFDEPFSAQDDVNATNMKNIIEELSKTKRVLLISH